jgi:hypothetical protein
MMEILGATGVVMLLTAVVGTSIMGGRYLHHGSSGLLKGCRH